ncbi:hypothetical protein BC332_07058 [Capsicum chinense]|nr:hypothetical protein BC332_07058 [Capsicum chinense]
MEGGLVVADGVSGDGAFVGGNGAAVWANDAPLAVFETTNHYYYGRTSFTDFAPPSECYACKCQDCKAKHSGVDVIVEATTEQHNITIYNLSIASKEEEKVKSGDEFHWVLAVVVLKERRIQVYDLVSERRRSRPSSEIQKMEKILPTYLDISGFLDQKICTNLLTIEAYWDKMGNPFDAEYVEGIAEQPIGRLDCGLFVAAYAEYLSGGLQVPNNGLDFRLLYKIYATLLWKYREAKAQKPYTSDFKDP